MLNKGFPEELALLNYFSNSSVTSYGSLALISGVTILGRILNGTLTTGIGFFGGIFFTAVFSRLTVEYSYAAYLLNTDRSYWGVYKDDEPPFEERLKIRLKKLSTYVVLGIGIIFFNTGFLWDKITTKPLYLIVGFITLIIVIFEAVVFVVWAFRKLKKAFTKKLKKSLKPQTFKKRKRWKKK
ncbi:hypothetical protein [Xylocopilactobacillus apicola]|uniref:Uncharacterized protein n=1 Tax=Xylocopilactobacillus apicola TaxID=2932184 RepID=A0AAU9DCZ5_9LACO|nr:hypothetical protein [Xylocopilactobacillus apicola]BDR59425.1 hypothetical protein XA3_18660 [Xylocopilactobacillus apicola]